MHLSPHYLFQPHWRPVLHNVCSLSQDVKAVETIRYNIIGDYNQSIHPQFLKISILVQCARACHCICNLIIPKVAQVQIWVAALDIDHDLLTFRDLQILTPNYATNIP